MIPVSFGPPPGLPQQTARAPTEPPATPAPAPLSGPAAVGRVEWAGAVRPADALGRAARADLPPKSDGDVPTGPPPAFAANVLDLLPESMMPQDPPADDARGALAGGDDAEG